MDDKPAGNLLYYGDNLDILRRYIKDESVDLIYLDPPFKSNQDYNVLFKERGGKQSAAQIRAFEDTWQWDEAAARSYQEVVEAGGKVSQAMQAFHTYLGTNDMLAYLAMMAPRLVELRRVLKPTGSIYLHCDPTASHYLKILMDAVLGGPQFLGEVVWRRTAAHVTSKRWPRLHDVILSYAKDASAVEFEPPRVRPDEGWIEREYRFEDKHGRYMVDNLTGAGTTEGPSGKPWRGVDPKRIGSGRHWRYSPETLDKLDSEGRIYWPAKGQYPKLKQYLHESGGKAVGDLWTDIGVLGRTAAERMGYPTQKPEALLERIIKASSNEDDLVLDPFCGCGTTVAVAQKLGRRWIGIDITHLAINLMKRRLRDAFGKDAIFEVVGEPVDLTGAKELASKDPYQFQWWALGLVDARPADQKKGADKGIDGRIYFHDEADTSKTKQVIISVKAGHTGVAHVRDLSGVLTREKAEIGVLISMEEPTQPMRAEAADAGFYHSPGWDKDYPRIQLRTIAELLAGKGLDVPQHHATFKQAPKHVSNGNHQLELTPATSDTDTYADAIAVSDKPTVARDAPRRKRRK